MKISTEISPLLVAAIEECAKLAGTDADTFVRRSLREECRMWLQNVDGRKELLLKVITEGLDEAGL